MFYSVVWHTHNNAQNPENEGKLRHWLVLYIPYGVYSADGEKQRGKNDHTEQRPMEWKDKYERIHHITVVYALSLLLSLCL